MNRARLALAATVLAASSAFIGPAAADTSGDANAMFVEAAMLAEFARGAPPDAALDMYEEAIALLDTIVAAYPDSEIATALEGGHGIGSFQPWAVRRAYDLLLNGPPPLPEMPQVDVVAVEDIDTDEAVAVAVEETAPPRPMANPCATPCEWQVNFGAGTGNPFGEDGDIGVARAAFVRDDHQTLAVGQSSLFQDGEIFVARLGPTGVVLDQTVLPGRLCAASRWSDGVAIALQRPDEMFEVWLIGGDTRVRHDLSFDQPVRALAGIGGGIIVVAAGSSPADGGTGPLVTAIGPGGTEQWRWTGEGVDGAAEMWPMATAALPDGGVRVLLRADDESDDPAIAHRWLADLGADGVLQAVVPIGADAAAALLDCDYSQDMAQIVPLDDGGTALRYLLFDVMSVRHWSIVSMVDGAGQEVWRRGMPLTLDDLANETEAEHDARIAAGVDFVGGLAPAREGAVWQTGYAMRPPGQSAMFVSLLDETGFEVWRIEWEVLHPAGDPSFDLAYAGSIAETPDGDLMVAYTGGSYRAPFGWIKRIDLPFGE